jgi:YVTN family beta-propeller protein
MKKTMILFALSCALVSCRKDEPQPEQPLTAGRGFYVLNEGIWQQNNASLDYYDYGNGTYRQNVYEEVNPGATLKLGDTGTDLGVCGAKMYAVINASNKVEVMDAATCRRIGQIAIAGCRYIVFAGGRAYVSAYGSGSEAGGFVAEIDTATLAVTRQVAVGRQPEEMAVVGDRLYVANSGGYSPEAYERTVSVIRLHSFTREKDIDVAINLHRLKADSNGDLYVTSRGDYAAVPPRLFVIDTQTETVKQTFDIPASHLCMTGSTACVIGTTYDAGWKTVNSYYRIDTQTETLLEGGFLSDNSRQAIETPYGMATDPVSGIVYITDARSNSSPGKLYAFSENGEKLFEHVTGYFPSCLAFISK